MSAERRLLFVCHYLHHVVGGAEIIGQKVVHGLRSAGCTVDTVVLPGPHPANSDRILEWNLPFGLRPGSLRGKQFAIYAGGLGIDASAARQIRRQISPGSHDMVVSHDTVSVGVAARLAESLGLPLVSFAYEPLPRLNPVNAGLTAPILGGLTTQANSVIRTALISARHRIAASADTAARLEKFAPGPPVSVVYNSAPVPSEARGDGVGLLFVGRLSREKGFDLLAEAYALCRSHPPLSIASLDGPLAAEAHELARRFPQVTLLPPIPPSGMEGVYGRHAAVVAPSTWPDPLPGAVLEARAFGRALLVSNEGGIPELIQGYRRSRCVDVRADRSRVVIALADAIDSIPDWAGVPVDPASEAGFRRRHDPATQMAGILQALENRV